MRILTRYLLRAHLGPFLFAFTVLTGLLLVNTVARRFEDLAGKGLEPGVIFEVFVLSLPHIVALTLPMSVLVSVLYTFSQLASENELTALKASGVNPTRLCLPILVAGAVVAAGMLGFNDRILPETNHALKNLLVDIGRKSPTLELRERVINEIRTGDMRTRYFLQAARIDPPTNRLWDVVIYDLSVADRSRTVYADSGRMAFNQERTDLILLLRDGVVHELESGGEERFQRVYFNEYQIQLEGVGNQLQRTDVNFRSDREMTLAMLADAAREREEELESLRREAASEALSALRQVLGNGDAPARQTGGPRTERVAPRIPGLSSMAQARPEGAAQADPETQRAARRLRDIAVQEQRVTQQANAYWVEYHKKYAIAFACLVFVLIGAPLGARFARGGVGTVIAISLAIFAVYYVSLIGGESFGDRGKVPPFWAMWSANAVGLVIGVWWLLRMGRSDTTQRGGDFGGRVLAALRWFYRLVLWDLKHDERKA